MINAHQKHHLHPGPSVKTPPSRGPTTLAVAKVTPVTPMYAARYCGLAVNAIMINEPVIAPPPPTPATILPKMRIELLGARAHIVFPASKIKIVVKNTLFKGKHLYCRRYIFESVTTGSPAAEKTQGTYSLAPCRLKCSVGDGVGGAIPTHILDRAKLVCDSGDRSRNDGLVQR